MSSTLTLQQTLRTREPALQLPANPTAMDRISGPREALGTPARPHVPPGALNPAVRSTAPTSSLEHGLPNLPGGHAASQLDDLDTVERHVAAKATEVINAPTKIHLGEERQGLRQASTVPSRNHCIHDLDASGRWSVTIQGS